MLRITTLCAVLLLAFACQAFAVTAVIENFDGAYKNGSIGLMPDGWNQFGYGVPASMQQETGIVYSGSATRWNVPGQLGNPVGTIAIYKLSQNLNNFALAGSPIDWTKSVTVSIDVFGVDYGTNTKFRTMLEAAGRTAACDWGNDGIANEQWTTLTATINPAQQSGNVILFLDFDFTNKSFSQTNAVIWDNLRMDYTAVPEPGSILALTTGLLGLAGLIRRRR